MADWIKLPESRKFLNLDRLVGPDLPPEKMKLTQIDSDYLLDQIGLRAAYRASKLRVSAGKNDYFRRPRTTSDGQPQERISKGRIL